MSLQFRTTGVQTMCLFNSRVTDTTMDPSQLDLILVTDDPMDISWTLHLV